MGSQSGIHSTLHDFLLYQGLAGYGPQAKSSWWQSLYGPWLRILVTFIKLKKKENTTKPKLWERDLQNLKYLLFGPSWEKFSDLDFFEFTVIYFSVTFLMGIWMFYRFLAPENSALGFLVHIFMHTHVCVSLGRVTRNKNRHIFKLSRPPPLVF